MLEDAKTALGVVEPLHRFGSSAFGPLHARALAADGVAGDWLPLGTLVRLPGFKELRCPRSAARPCVLVGTNLFLAASISASSQFNKPTDVPPDFTGTELSVPHPANGVLYLKLRDDSATVQTLTLPVMPLNSATQSAAAPPAAVPSEDEPSVPAVVTEAAPVQAQPKAAPDAATVAQAQPKAAPETAPAQAQPKTTTTTPTNTHAPAPDKAGP